MGAGRVGWAEVSDGAGAATASVGGRIVVAVIGVLIGVLPGGVMLTLVIRRKTRQSATADLNDVYGYGWSSIAQKVTFSVGGAALTLIGLLIVAFAIWPPSPSAGTPQQRGGLSNPWTWVIVGAGVLICLGWAYLSRDDGRMKPEEPQARSGGDV